MEIYIFENEAVIMVISISTDWKHQIIERPFNLLLETDIPQWYHSGGFGQKA